MENFMTLHKTRRKKFQKSSKMWWWRRKKKRRMKKRKRKEQLLLPPRRTSRIRGEFQSCFGLNIFYSGRKYTEKDWCGLKCDITLFKVVFLT